MKILITGSAGFIGSHLRLELEGAGHQVWGHDLMDGDLSAPGTFSHLLSRRTDLVVHLAAHVGRIRGEDDLAFTIRQNAQTTTLIASACGRLGVPVLYASTSEVYGDQGEEVLREESPWLLPHNLYGLTKRWGEEALELYAPDDLKIVRLSMPYGPGVPPGRGRRALDNILWQAHHRMPIPIHRGAERSWCWVGDTVAGIRMVIEKGKPGAYNVGRDDRPLAMVDLAEMCCELADCPVDRIELIDPPAAQTVVKRLSTAKLMSLGWKPKVELHEGLPLVYDWIRRFDREGALCE